MPDRPVFAKGFSVAGTGPIPITRDDIPAMAPCFHQAAACPDCQRGDAVAGGVPAGMVILRGTERCAKAARDLHRVPA